MALMQTNGEFVLYDNEKIAKWRTTGRQTFLGPHLIMQNDGNLVLYDAKKNALWNTGTHSKCRGIIRLVIVQMFHLILDQFIHR